MAVSWPSSLFFLPLIAPNKIPLQHMEPSNALGTPCAWLCYTKAVTLLLTAFPCSFSSLWTIFGHSSLWALRSIYNMKFSLTVSCNRKISRRLGSVIWNKSRVSHILLQEEAGRHSNINAPMQAALCFGFSPLAQHPATRGECCWLQQCWWL